MRQDKHKMTYRYKAVVSWVLVALLAIMPVAQDAMAAGAMPFSSASIMSVAAAPPDAAGGSTCTTDFPENPSAQDGLLTQIVDYIKEVLETAMAELYTGIVTNSAFVNAVNAAFALFIALFGVMFMFGLVPFTFGQALTRLMKIAVILALINEGFSFFAEYAVRFFNDGTDELIDGIIGIATGDTSGVSVGASGSPQPFTKLEGVVGDVLSPEMMIAMVSSFTTGPVGPAMGGILALGIMAFVRAIIKALQIYCISLVVKALLLGMAPIFITFILFDRTKHIFSGWVNQLVNYSLQPILMFAFLSFYIILLESSASNILGVNICWTEFDHMEGSASSTAMWRMQNTDGSVTVSDHTWNGYVDCLKSGGDCPDFPISIIDMLTFLILAHLAFKFSEVVTLIATEISASSLFLDKLRSGFADQLKQGQGGRTNTRGIRGT